MSPHDPVRRFLRERGCPPHVVADGLAGLLALWEGVVDEVAAVYRLGLDDYRNDMDGRQVLGEALEFATPEEAAALRLRIEEADARLKQLVVPAGRCLWGDGEARSRRWSPEAHWWYFTRPAQAGPELEDDLEAIDL